MRKEQLAERLFFKYNETNNVYSKRFRGFMIKYFPETNKFYLLRKETTSSGDYTSEVDFKDCSKPVKMLWLLINALIEIDNSDYNIEGYSDRIENLLIKMYYAKTYNIPDDGYSSANMYMVAERYYRRIMEATK